MKRTSEALIVQPSSDLEKSIDGLNKPLALYLQDLGLPTDGVLYSIEDRKQVINALSDVISILPMDQREKSYYLTKFTVAIAAGLFDGALNYLWNETIAALRRLVLKFDISYFFSVAEKISPRLKSLSDEDDLDQIGDHDLLEVCRRVGLVSDVNYQRLVHVNYMRNHASAAHPNDNEIDGFEILGWLRVCLRHAITAEPDHSVISIKKLIKNVRTVEIPADDLAEIGSDIARMPQEQIDDLLWAIFGMFIDPRVASHTKANIAGIAPYGWDASTDNRKFEIGSRFGVFRKNGEVLRKDATQEFLNIVRGLPYRDEDSLAGELIEKLETLKRVHFGWDNFHNEYPHARSIEDSLPANLQVPRAARGTWVKVISLCFVGNGHGHREGVDERALPYYQKYISSFSEEDAVEFARLFLDQEFASILLRKKTDERARHAASILRDKVSNVHLKRALDLVVTAPDDTLAKVGNTTDFQKTLALVPRS